MTGKPRTQASRSAATRDALVLAARTLFAEHGYAGVGTEAIVRAAGVTRGAMYHHFADKVELFAAAFEAVEAEITSRLDAAVGSAGSTDPISLMKYGAGVWLEAAADPAIHRIVLVDAPAVLGWQRWREVGLKYGLGLVQSLVEFAMSTGAIASQPSVPLAHVLIGALDEAAVYVATAADPVAARGEVTAALGQLIDGLAVQRP